jgi:hypothetical protein
VTPTSAAPRTPSEEDSIGCEIHVDQRKLVIFGQKGSTKSESRVRIVDISGESKRDRKTVVVQDVTVIRMSVTGEPFRARTGRPRKKYTTSDTRAPTSISRTGRNWDDTVICL